MNKVSNSTLSSSFGTSISSPDSSPSFFHQGACMCFRVVRWACLALAATGLDLGRAQVLCLLPPLDLVPSLAVQRWCWSVPSELLCAAGLALPQPCPWSSVAVVLELGHGVPYWPHLTLESPNVFWHSHPLVASVQLGVHQWVLGVLAKEQIVSFLMALC